MMSDGVRSRNTAALRDRFAAVFTLREVFLMKCKVMLRTEAVLGLRVSTADADALRKASTSKQARFMREAWKNLSPFPQPRSVTYYVARVAGNHELSFVTIMGN